MEPDRPSLHRSKNRHSFVQTARSQKAPPHPPWFSTENRTLLAYLFGRVATVFRSFQTTNEGALGPSHLGTEDDTTSVYRTSRSCRRQTGSYVLVNTGQPGSIQRKICEIQLLPKNPEFSGKALSGTEATPFQRTISYCAFSWIVSNAPSSVRASSMALGGSWASSWDAPQARDQWLRPPARLR